jgi:hypothetical protein
MQLPLSRLLNLTGSLLPLNNLPSFSNWLPSNPASGNLVPLPPGQFAELVPYIEFARAAYCDPSKIAGWKCGGQLFSLRPFPFSPADGAKEACRAVPGFIPTLRGGDGDGIQFCKQAWAAIPRRGILFTCSDLIEDDRLCRFLACPVCCGGSTPRHRPVEVVSLFLLSIPLVNT